MPSPSRQPSYDTNEKPGTDRVLLKTVAANLSPKLTSDSGPAPLPASAGTRKESGSRCSIRGGNRTVIISYYDDIQLCRSAHKKKCKMTCIQFWIIFWNSVLLLRNMKQRRDRLSDRFEALQADDLDENNAVPPWFVNLMIDRV